MNFEESWRPWRRTAARRPHLTLGQKATKALRILSNHKQLCGPVTAYLNPKLGFYKTYSVARPTIQKLHVMTSGVFDF